MLALVYHMVSTTFAAASPEDFHALGNLSTGACIPMTNQNGVYTASLGIGTPPQMVRAVPDTGSYNLVVTSTMCDTPACRTHMRYNIESSTSFEAQGNATYTLSYGQGDVVVKDALETVTFFPTLTGEGAIASHHHVDVQLIQEQQLMHFAGATFDSILGLGKRNDNGMHHSAFLSDMGVNEFTVCLGGLNVFGDGMGGRLEVMRELDVGSPYLQLTTFGDYAWGTPVTYIGVSDTVVPIVPVPLSDSYTYLESAEAAKATGLAAEAASAQGGRHKAMQGGRRKAMMHAGRGGTLHPVKLREDEVRLDDKKAAVLSEVVQCSDEAPCAAIVDSGTTLLTFPTDVYNRLLAEVEAGCTTQTNCLQHLEESDTCDGPYYEALPDLTITVGGQSLTVRKEIYMGAVDVDVPVPSPAPDDPDEIHSMHRHVQGVACLPLFDTMDDQTQYGPLLILGMPFLRAYATRFDRTTGGMAVAQVPAGTDLCNQCASTRRVHSVAMQAQRQQSHQGHSQRLGPLKVSEVRGPNLVGLQKKGEKTVFL